MRHHQTRNGPNRLLVRFIIVLFLPYVFAKVTMKLAINHAMLAVALLTPVDWNEEEEDLLRKAIWHGYLPSDLVFTFWRRAKDIDAKAREMGLL